MRQLLARGVLLVALCATAGCDQVRDILKNGGIVAHSAPASATEVAGPAAQPEPLEVADTKSAVSEPPLPQSAEEPPAETIDEVQAQPETTGEPEPVSAPAAPPAAQTAAPALAEKAIPDLRYGWKAGRDYPYRVRVDVKYADVTETLQGTPVYHVKASDPISTTLVFRGSLTSRRKHDNGFPAIDPFRYSPFSPFGGVSPASGAVEHEVVVNSRGSVKQVRGESQLPYLLGHLSLLVLDPLPEKPRKSWSVTNGVTIRVHSGRFPFPSRRFGRAGSSRLFGPESTAENFIEAAETVTFKIARIEQGTALIAKDYELKSQEKFGDHPRFSIVGHGETLFDIAEGVPLRSEFNLCVAGGGQPADDGVPVMVSYELLSGKEFKRWQAETAQQRSRQDATTPGTSESLLESLASDDPAILRRAAEQARGQLPAGTSPEQVLELLVRQLHHPDVATREAVVKTLAQRVEQDQLAILVEALEDASVTVRWAALDGLSRFPTAAAVEAIAGRMHDSSDRLPAARLLKSMGPVAEPAMLKQLSSDDWRTRQAAAEVLQVVGTQAAIPALERMQSDDDSDEVQSAARRALEAIRARTAKPGESEPAEP